MSKIKKEAADVVNEEVFSSTIHVLCLSLSSCNSQLKHALYVNWEAGTWNIEVSVTLSVLYTKLGRD